MINELYSSIIYLLKLTVETEALWIVMPLAISTLLIVVYFGIYKEEQAGWNTHLSNSFVLLFVSIALIRHIYLIDNGGAFNFINYWSKTLLTIAILSIGIILVRFNFGHILPEKFANYLNSPLTVNFIAYVVVLLVYSVEPFSWLFLISAILIVLILIGILILIKIPMSKFAEYLEKEKIKDRRRNLKEAKYQIEETKEELKAREKELRRLEIKEINNKKKEAIRLKNILKKK